MKRSTALLLLALGVLGCHSEEGTKAGEPRLDYYVESYDLPDLGFQPQLKVNYQYNSKNKLIGYVVSSYTPDTGNFQELRHIEVIYTGDAVSKILEYLPNEVNPYLEYIYEYRQDGRVLKIGETNSSTGISSVAEFQYDDANGSVKVAYAFSNGGSFEYEFQLMEGNIVTDKTTRGAQLCSEGSYTYDDHVNPFQTLGYTDYLLINLSKNNKLVENINYVSCAFPSLIPESYSYKYNGLGYPTLITTHYKPGADAVTSQKEIFYK